MAHPYQQHRDSGRARARQYQSGGSVPGYAKGIKEWLFPTKEGVGKPPEKVGPTHFTSDPPTSGLNAPAGSMAGAANGALGGAGSAAGRLMEQHKEKLPLIKKGE